MKKKLQSLYWSYSVAQKQTGRRPSGGSLYEVEDRMMFPAFNDIKPTPANGRAAAVRAAEWLLRTQVNTAENLSGDTGRFYGIRGLYDNTRYLSQNWLSAHCVLAELAAFHATGREEFLTSARLGGEYLLGLQVLDARLPEAFGSYREHHARFPLTGSRSCCSVIWAMVQLYHATGNPEYLESAEMCGRWYLEQAFPPELAAPRLEYFIPTREWLQDWSGCYNGGNAIMFQQLYRITGKPLFLERGVIAIADMFINYFLRKDGSRIQAVDCATGKESKANKKSFHIYNDDFAGISLLAAWKETGDRKYRDAALRLARWLVKQTEPSGRIGGVNDAAATSLVLGVNLKRMLKTREFDAAMQKWVHWIMRWQVTDIAAADFHGGIRGQGAVTASAESGHYIDARITSYAVNGLLGWAVPKSRMLLEVEK